MQRRLAAAFPRVRPGPIMSHSGTLPLSAPHAGRVEVRSGYSQPVSPLPGLISCVCVLVRCGEGGWAHRRVLDMPGARVQGAGLAGWLSRDPRAGPLTGRLSRCRRIVIRWFTRSRSPNTASLVTRSASLRPGVTWLAAARGLQTPLRSARPTTGPERSPQAGAQTPVDGWYARPAGSVTVGLRSGE